MDFLSHRPVSGSESFHDWDSSSEKGDDLCLIDDNRDVYNQPEGIIHLHDILSEGIV